MIFKKQLKRILGEVSYFRIKLFIESYYPSNRQLLAKRKRFYGQFVKKGDLCFDIGANVGNRIAALLEIGARVIAVEPQEFCDKVLKSRFGNKVTIINKGLASEEGVRKLHVATSSTISSFSEEWISAVKDTRLKSYAWTDTVDVPMTTLDSLIAEFGLPEFVKIDVEGYEVEVLKGLSSRVKMISFEYTLPEQTQRLYECMHIIRDLNPNAECNYSMGESMEWAMQQWLRVPEFLEFIQSPRFPNPGLGDIYIREVSL